jgi:hypothetical protein
LAGAIGPHFMWTPRAHLTHPPAPTLRLPRLQAPIPGIVFV